MRLYPLSLCLVCALACAGCGHRESPSDPQTFCDDPSFWVGKTLVFDRAPEVVSQNCTGKGCPPHHCCNSCSGRAGYSCQDSRVELLLEGSEWSCSWEFCASPGCRRSLSSVQRVEGVVEASSSNTYWLTDLRVQ
jgi:hypothetical protein